MALTSRLGFALLGLSGALFVIGFAVRVFYNSTCSDRRELFGWASLGLFMAAVGLLVSASVVVLLRQRKDQGSDLRRKAMALLAVLGVSASIVALVLLAGTRLPPFDACHAL